jgi:uncharacterized membrane protein
MLLKTSADEARSVSRQLRLGKSPHLRRRRQILGLSLLASATMGYIALYQTGIINHLYEPPLHGLDGDKVDASEEAYEKRATPDAVLGLNSYATTATLAAMGPEDRAVRQPIIPLLLTGKLVLDAFQAAKLSWDQWAKHKTFCFWCLTATTASFLSLPLVFGETRDALKALWNKIRE